MENEVDVLIVSTRIENKRTLLRYPRRPARKHILSVDRFSSAGISRDPSAAIISCEERHPDGSYRDLLGSVPGSPQMNRLIVAQCTGEWEGTWRHCDSVRRKCRERRCNLRTLISRFSTPCGKDARIKRWPRNA